MFSDGALLLSSALVKMLAASAAPSEVEEPEQLEKIEIYIRKVQIYILYKYSK